MDYISPLEGNLYTGDSQENGIAKWYLDLAKKNKYWQVVCVPFLAKTGIIVTIGL